MSEDELLSISFSCNKQKQKLISDEVNERQKLSKNNYNNENL